MHNLTILEQIWNTQKHNFDLLIYVPHHSIDKDFIKKVRETSKISLDYVSDDLLYKYMYHEADTWVVEVLESMKKYLEKSEFSIWILKILKNLFSKLRIVFFTPFSTSSIWLKGKIFLNIFFDPHPCQNTIV